jgi:hypothetical protein
MALSARFNLQLDFDNKVDDANGTKRDKGKPDFGGALTDGSGASQANKIWRRTAESLVATTVDYDLAGVLTDVFGTVLTFTKLKGLMIRNNNTTSGHVLIVGGATNPVPLFSDASDKHPIAPGGSLILFGPLADGICAVTAGTGDKLRLDAGANTISYDIVLIGV